MKSDGKVVISTDLDNHGLEKGIKSIKGSLGGLTSVVKSLGAAIAAAFSVGAIVNFATASVKAANELSDALTGLKSILDGQGRSFTDAEKFLQEYTADGLIPMTNAVAAYKNLAARGYEDAQIQQTLTALKDASAFGRQSSYSMGEAVQSATEGLKNENSVLVDNAGVTKNVAKMWEEYAASIGTTANELTKERKIQAEVNGIIEETRFQSGDAAKVAGTLNGQLSQLSVNFNNLKVAVGNAISPIVQSFLPAINAAVAAMTQFANSIASVTSALFGSVSSTTADAVTDVADSYGNAASNAEDLVDATTEAGKAAKKYLAGFDEITRIGDSAGAAGSTSAGSTNSVSTTVTATTEVKDELSPKIQAVIDKITALFEPLKNIDFTPAVEAFGRQKEAAEPLTKKLFEGLEWVWNSLLVPLAQWTIEDALPAFLDFLCNSLTEITDLVEKLEDLLSGNSTISDFLGGLTETQTALLAIAVALESIAIAAGGFATLNSITGFFASIKALNAVGLIGKIAEVFAIAASGAGTFSEAISLVFGPGSIIAGIAAVIGGIVLAATNLFSMLKNGFNWVKEALMVVGIAISAACAIILGAPALVAGVVAAVVAAVATAIVVIKDNWEEISQFFSDLYASISQWASEVWEGIVTAASDCWDAIVEFFTPAIEWFSELFGSIWQTISDVFYNIGVLASGCWEIIKAVWGLVSGWFNDNVVKPVANFFAGLWNGFTEAASKAWDGVKAIFGKVASFFEDVFSDAWKGVVAVFSVAGEIFTDIKDGILTAFKAVVNGVITGLNNAIAVPFNGINAALEKIRDINILGLTPFSGIKTINVPQIPQLAQGAVLPANKPFLAVVGDQKHGTNVEAPLSTIQEAVAIVMEDMIQSNIAGHEATVAVLKEILEAVLGIHIGDDVVGQAVARYNSKMAIIKGGSA